MTKTRKRRYYLLPDIFSISLFRHFLCYGSEKNEIEMRKSSEKKAGRSLDMRSIFRVMMEEGYYPIYERTHIVFGLDDNLAVLEYEEGVLSVRLFFSIEQESYPLFLEAANQTMLKAFSVKPVVLDDMKNLMFSCEILCDTVREFRKFLPRTVELLRESLTQHRSEMKKLLLVEESTSKTIPATDDYSSMAGIHKSHKVVS